MLKQIVQKHLQKNNEEFDIENAETLVFNKETVEKSLKKKSKKEKGKKINK